MDLFAKTCFPTVCCEVWHIIHRIFTFEWVCPRIDVGGGSTMSPLLLHSSYSYSVRHQRYMFFVKKKCICLNNFQNTIYKTAAYILASINQIEGGCVPSDWSYSVPKKHICRIYTFIIFKIKTLICPFQNKNCKKTNKCSIYL